MTRHLVSCALAVAAALTVAACNADGSASPTSPSASRARGAVIVGRVTGVSSATTVSSATSADASGPMATSRVTVTIVGTSISTVTDGDGRFTLTGVPPGDVQLKFTGSGIDATITLTGISADQRVTITVALNGRGARLESERREDDDDDDDDDDDEAKLEGGISNLSGACPNLTFTVRQTTVRTNSATKFDDGPCSRLANNGRVKVEGQRQPDGSILAKEVELDDDDDEDDDDNDETKLEGGISSLSGACPNLTFTVRQTTVRTNSSTKFEDGPCSRLANNRRVKVEGQRQSDGSILAKEVELDD